MPELQDALTRYVQEETPHSAPPFDTVRARARRQSHRRTVALSVGAVILVAGGGTVAGRQLDSGPASPVRAAQAPVPRAKKSPSTGTTLVPAPSAGRGALPLGGVALRCVESYNLQTLQNRAFAFDGTVVSIGPERYNRVAGPAGDPGYLGVTFKVNGWFRGGSQATVTVDMLSPTKELINDGSISSQKASYGIGSRLLVSGEPRWGGLPLQDPVGWACGFTRYYDQQTADSWRHAFASKGSSRPGS